MQGAGWREDLSGQECVWTDGKSQERRGNRGQEVVDGRRREGKKTGPKEQRIDPELGEQNTPSSGSDIKGAGRKQVSLEPVQQEEEGTLA